MKNCTLDWADKIEIWKEVEAASKRTSAQAPVEDRGESQLVGSGSLVGPLAKRYWKAPFRYEEMGTMILDANGERTLDVRGWGRLTGKGALGLDEATAARIQDEFAQSVVRVLNASWPNDEAQTRSGESPSA